jgi:TDG/mug DNA glycosylase family protein
MNSRHQLHASVLNAEVVISGDRLLNMSQEDRRDDQSAVLKSHDHDDLGEAVVEELLDIPAAEPADFKASLKRFRHVSHQDDGVHGVKPAEPAEPIASRKRGINQIAEHATTVTKSPTPTKKRRQSSKYAPPSKYAHLSKLVDIIEPNLIGVFVGFNPGVRTATAGHAYAHPSNMFWKLLHSSGITDVRLRPEQDGDLPRLYSMGNTNIVDRPSKDAGELSKQEMAAGTPILEEKIRAFRPEAVCIVGKSIWQAIWRWKYKREIKKEEFKYGWQDEKERMGKEGDWPGALVFVATATSGLAASLKPHEKEAIWKPFGEWVQKRREERRLEAADAN